MQSVSLPVAVVKVTTILPRYGASGQYALLLLAIKLAMIHWQSSASAISNGDREEISINLDLRTSKAGAYLLSATQVARRRRITFAPESS